MSATMELTPWQALKSHQVNCAKGCTRKKVVCIVGRILLARAMKEPEKSQKPKSFPFVAKLYERIAVNINGQWTEAVVKDRSIQNPEMYEKTDWETGTTTWRTAGAKVVGYEVETDDKVRHYVRPYQTKSLRKRLERVSEGKVPSSVGQAPRTVQPQSNDWLIRR